MTLFVDVARTTQPLQGKAVTIGASTPAMKVGDPTATATKKPTLQVFESNAVVRPPRPDEDFPPCPLNGDAFVRAWQRQDGDGWVTAAQKLPAAERAAALTLPFTGVVPLTFEGCAFLTLIARFSLYELQLSPDQWLVAVIASALEQNNPVLDTAVKKASGANVQAVRAQLPAFEAEHSYRMSYLVAALDRVT